MSAKERVLAGIATINADPNIVNKGQAVEQFVQQNYPEQWGKIKQMAVDRANNPTQAESMQGGSILRPANPEDGLVDIRQSRAKSTAPQPGPTGLAGRIQELKTDLANGVITPDEYKDAFTTAAKHSSPERYDEYRRFQESKVAGATPNSPDYRPTRIPIETRGESVTGGPPPSIFSQFGSGLKSAGKSMSGYAEKLFNDPSRMAMLQGGLSMMNPNSYYDKQGFGSVFQGLQAGLGQAQAGHKGVLDRRALVQETASKKAAADKAMRGGAYTNVKMPNGKTGLQKDGRLLGVFSTTFKPESSPALIKLMDMRDAAYAAGNQTRGDEIQQQIFKLGFIPDVFSSTNTGVYQHHVQRPGSGSKYITSDILSKGHKPPTQAQVAQAGSNVSAAGRGIANVGALYGKLSDSGAMVGGELFGGNIVSNWNTFVDNIGWDNLSNDNRSEIDSLQNALKRDLPKEFLQDDKSKSNFDKKLVLDSFGYDKVSSRKTKMKAMPDVLGLLYEKYVKNSQVMGDPPVGLRAYLEHKKIPEALIKKVEDKSNGSFSADPFKSDKKKFQAGSGKGKFY